MNCHDALAALHGYLDGELDLSATLEYEQHLRDCPACSKTLADQKTLRTAMKADALYYHAPENLRERVRLDLHGHGADFGARVRWNLAAAACLVCGVGLGIVVTLFALSPSRQERLAQEGHRSVVLVAYGTYWYPWFVRRLAERPANLWFMLRNVFAS